MSESVTVYEVASLDAARFENTQVQVDVGSRGTSVYLRLSWDDADLLRAALVAALAGGRVRLVDGQLVEVAS